MYLVFRNKYNTPGFPVPLLINFPATFPVFLSYFSKTNRLFGFIFSFLYICIKGSRQYLLI